MEAGDILLQKGLIDQHQLDVSRAERTNGTRVDQIAVEKGFVAEEDALRAIGDYLGLEFIDLAETEIDPELSPITGWAQRFLL